MVIGYCGKVPRNTGVDPDASRFLPVRDDLGKVP
jgi:hypothetical protein